MNIHSQVCPLNISKEIANAFTIKFENVWIWLEVDNPFSDEKDWDLCLWGEQHTGKKYYPAFTVAELGDLLPTHYSTIKNEIGGWVCFARWDKNDVPNMFGRTEAESRSEMLAYLIKNQLWPF